jgi:hypothetical protein
MLPDWKLNVNFAQPPCYFILYYTNIPMIEITYFGRRCHENFWAPYSLAIMSLSPQDFAWPPCYFILYYTNISIIEITYFGRRCHEHFWAPYSVVIMSLSPQDFAWPPCWYYQSQYILTATSINMSVFWDVTPCILVKIY